LPTSSENAVRRLAEVAEVVEVTGKPLDEIAAVADPFRAPGRSLLMPAPGRMVGYTSRGLGVGEVPLRFNSRGEISVITLRQAVGG
jgi:hypothetical protein